MGGREVINPIHRLGLKHQKISNCLMFSQCIERVHWYEIGSGSLTFNCLPKLRFWLTIPNLIRDTFRQFFFKKKSEVSDSCNFIKVSQFHIIFLSRCYCFNKQEQLNIRVHSVSQMCHSTVNVPWKTSLKWSPLFNV